jgi:hypothetical protein
LAWAQAAQQGAQMPDQIVCLDRPEAEHDNLRAALRLFYELGDMERACLLGAALNSWWLD